MVRDVRSVGDISVERILLKVDPGILVPLVLQLPPRREGGRCPIVVALAQEGKQGFLRHRPETIADLLRGGAVVCLPDLRGTGETRPAGDARGRTGAATALSSSELMLGRTLVGARLRDLVSVLNYLFSRGGFDPKRVALWGDSFAPVNPPDRRLEVPLDAEKLPDQAEPLGPLLALLGGLFEDRVGAVYARGGLDGYHALLGSPFCYVPHDAIVPGAVSAGDLDVVAAGVAPRPLALAGLVDGLNRPASPEQVQKAIAFGQAAYRAWGKPEHLVLGLEPDRVAGWLLNQGKD
jgi:hypothetical protein